jgi:hypothetical protein
VVRVTVPASGGRYEIRVNGILDSRWSEWFEGLLVEHRDEDTVILGRLTDQAALHGLLTKIRDFGLFLVSVRYLDAEDEDAGERDE